jgi:hypothetical protein
MSRGSVIGSGVVSAEADEASAAAINLRVTYTDDAGDGSSHTAVVVLNETHSVAEARAQLVAKFRAYLAEGALAEDFALYRPRGRGRAPAGWLDDARALATYGLADFDELELRPYWTRLRVRGSSQASLQVSVHMPSSASELMDRVLDSVGVANVVVLLPEMHNRGVRLDPLADPAELRFPGEASVSVVAPEAPPPGEPAAAVLPSCSLFFWTPFYRGTLYKKSNSGLVRSWKKRWFVLSRDTLAWFRNQNDSVAQGAVRLHDVSSVAEPLSPPDLAARRGAAECYFEIAAHAAVGPSGTERFIGGRRYQLLAEAADQRLMWTKILRQWLRYHALFDRPTRAGAAAAVATAPTSTLATSSFVNQQFSESIKLSESRRRQRVVLTARRPTDGAALVLTAAAPSRPSASPAAAAAALVPASSWASPAAASSAPAAAAAAAPLDLASNERCMRVRLRAGAPPYEFIVEEDVALYGLAYALAGEIGAAAIDALADEDFLPTRRVDLLDHRRSLGELRVPATAEFCIKNTGVDAPADADPLFDNHFLFVVLPRLSAAVHLCVLLDAGVLVRCEAALEGPCVTLRPAAAADDDKTTYVYLSEERGWPRPVVRTASAVDVMHLAALPGAAGAAPQTDTTLVVEARNTTASPLALVFETSRAAALWADELARWLPYFAAAGSTCFDHDFMNVA